MADWHIGQKVVSLSSIWGSEFSNYLLPPDYPRPIAGMIYTIAEILPIRVVFFSLEEIGWEYGWWVSRKFRPVDERDSQVETGVPSKIKEPT